MAFIKDQQKFEIYGKALKKFKQYRVRQRGCVRAHYIRTNVFILLPFITFLIFCPEILGAEQYNL